MKRNIIATVIATAILFVWQALSWMALPVHNDTLKYTPQQAEIMSVLSSKLPQEGAYALPGNDPDAKLSYEQMEQQSKQYIGKPWAVVFYNSRFEGMSASNLFTGFLLNLFAAAIAVGLVHMGGTNGRTSGRIFAMVMLLPFFCTFQAVLINWNWWSFPGHFIKGEIIDLIIGWALCGAFLAWYLGRRGAADMPETKRKELP